MTVRIITGDCRDVLATLPADSVHCVVTSPPYWGLRDYGVDGQIGLESDFAAYVEEMVAVFRQVRRVLRLDGTLWLNLGDSYHNGDKGGYAKDRVKAEDSMQRSNLGANFIGAPNRQPQHGLKPKDLTGIPWRVAFALQADGWWLRQDIIWSKPNPMPESVTDRCTKAHEYLFLLSKSERYWFDAAAIAEPLSQSTIEWARGKAGWGPSNPGHGTAAGTHGPSLRGDGRCGESGDTRNRRSVWTVSTEPFSGARLMRDASGGSYRKASPDCPMHGDRPTPASSAQRGEPRAASRSVRNPSSDNRLAPSLFDERAPIEMRHGAGSAPDSLDLQAQRCSETATPHSTETRKTGRAPETSLHETIAEGLACRTGGSEPQRETVATSDHILVSRTEADCGPDGLPLGPEGRIAYGIARKCTCEEYSTVTDHFAVFPPALIEPCILAGCPAGGTVLDPFGGAGTTGLVADRLRRDAILIEINPGYAEMARRRIEDDAPLLANIA